MAQKRLGNTVLARSDEGGRRGAEGGDGICMCHLCCFPDLTLLHFDWWCEMFNMCEFTEQFTRTVVMVLMSLKRNTVGGGVREGGGTLQEYSPPCTCSFHWLLVLIERMFTSTHTHTDQPPPQVSNTHFTLGSDLLRNRK